MFDDDGTDWYRYREGRHDTYEVLHRVMGVVMDCIPTEAAAKSIACELERARSMGYAAAKNELRVWLGVRL